jgi:hypothetical protein
LAAPATRLCKVWLHRYCAVAATAIYVVVAAAIVLASIQLPILTMEPIFAKTAGETVTPKLRAQLDVAIAALPPAHRCALPH